MGDDLGLDFWVWAYLGTDFGCHLWEEYLDGEDWEGFELFSSLAQSVEDY